MLCTFRIFGPDNPMSDAIRHQYILLFLRAFPHRLADDVTLETQREIGYRDRFIIAFSGTDMIGFATWRYHGGPAEGTAELFHFGIDAHDMRARGLADQLMVEFERDAEVFYQKHGQPGWNLLYLWTHDSSPLPHRVYERASFKQIFTWFGRYKPTAHRNGHERLYEKTRSE